ncbi:hypothetical protein OS493_034711 [Desmophyllum pertusum]|uniref:Ammonium transporter AmtB-like domain-containing protein n=1 Tax=Desmophyllum pertusum TaxID=174260 RepID=A0A9W9ZAC1_9CNID|nr:hypothetical protein OS493_034711 [Desmophyllum pertusum]
MTDLLQGIMAGLVGVSACAGSVEVWASLIIGVVVGLTSSVVSWSVQKYQPLWTSTGMHDITYTHGIPGILGAVAAGLFAKSSKDVTSADGAFYSMVLNWVVKLLGVAVGLNSSNTNEALGSYDTSDSSPSSILSKEKEVLHKKLFKAVAAGDLQKLDTLIVKQVSFGVQDFDKRTPL